MKFLYVIIILLIVIMSIYVIFFKCKCSVENYVKNKLEEIRLILCEVHPKAKKLKFSKGNESFTLNKSRGYFMFRR